MHNYVQDAHTHTHACTHTRACTHTHAHTLQTNRCEEQCCLAKIFLEEKCLECAFEGMVNSGWNPGLPPCETLASDCQTPQPLCPHVGNPYA